MANKRNKQIKPSLIRRIMTSTAFNILVPILSLYNLILSYYVYRQESKILRNAINDNNDLTDRLLKMNAYASKFSAIIHINVSYIDADLPVQQLQDNVRRNLITLLDNMVVSNDLLGVIVIKIEPNRRFQRFDVKLQPANTELVLLNLRDFVIGAVLYAVSYIAMNIFI